MKKIILMGTIGVLLLASSVVVAQDGPSLDAETSIRLIAELAESAISNLIEKMHVMTATANLRTGDWDQMVDLLAQFEQSNLSYNAWFLQSDGSYYKVATGLASANLSDRAYFSRVMAGETTWGDLVVSRSTGRKSAILTAPIFNGPTVIGALGVTLYLDDFSSHLYSLVQLPENLEFYAYGISDSLITVHADAASLLEPVDSLGSLPSADGTHISDVLGWGFVLGTRR